MTHFDRRWLQLSQLGEKGRDSPIDSTPQISAHFLTHLIAAKLMSLTFVYQLDSEQKGNIAVSPLEVATGQFVLQTQ